MESPWSVQAISGSSPYSYSLGVGALSDYLSRLFARRSPHPTTATTNCAKAYCDEPNAAASSVYPIEFKATTLQVNQLVSTLASSVRWHQSCYYGSWAGSSSDAPTASSRFVQYHSASILRREILNSLAACSVFLSDLALLSWCPRVPIYSPQAAH